METERSPAMTPGRRWLGRGRLASFCGPCCLILAACDMEKTASLCAHMLMYSCVAFLVQ